jgi:hypothetical protein
VDGGGSGTVSGQTQPLVVLPRSLNMGVFAWVAVVSPAQRRDHGQPELGSHMPPHLVWHSSPTQSRHL